MFVVNIMQKINKLNVHLFFKEMEMDYVYMILQGRYAEKRFVQIILKQQMMIAKM